MPAMRAPTDERAPALPRTFAEAFPFERKMVRVRGRRIHVVDEGRGRPVVFFHGNPTWSFLWRKVLAELLGDGLRLIAPDLLGFGLSDKLAKPAQHQVALHLDVMTELVQQMGIERPVLVGQDWGGPIAAGVGMRLSRAGSAPSGFVFANTAILEPVRPFRRKAFHRFSHVPILSDIAFRGLLFPVPILDRVQGDRRSMGLRERAAYAWPFLRLGHRAGPLGLARMVPHSEDHPSTPVLDEIGKFVRGFEGPVAFVWGERDPILGRALARHRAAFPHATARTTPAGHFLQEEVPRELADAVREVVERSEPPPLAA
jgi:haloalkane dehalogenase